MDPQQRIERLERELEEARSRAQRAEQASEARGRLIAHVSHEIRTPLNGVLGLAELALQAAHTPSQKRHLVMAVEAGHALLQTVNDLLDFSRLEAGRMPLHEEAFSLPELLASTFRGVMPQMRSKGLLVRYDYAGPVSWVRGDVTRLRQIVTNLLGNAVKFTPKGELSLVAEVQPPQQGRTQATIRVQDTGPGLDPGLRDHLFEAFAQGLRAPLRGHGGAGLGLSIARGLARTMGGDLVADSAPGQGCTFTLTLAFEVAEDPQPLDLPPPGTAWLVFPDPHIVDWVAMRFTRVGWRFRGFSTFEAAIEAADRAAPAERPQLLLVSERALRLDTTLVEAHRAMPQTAVHLLVRPDWNLPSLEQQALKQGVTLNIAPLTPRDVLLMTHSAARGEHPAAFSSRERDVLVVEEDEVNQLIGEEFLRALGASPRVAGSSEAAVQACLARPPRLALIDVNLPGVDGRETCRRLRRLQREGRLPSFAILGLSAHATGSEREACLAAGMDGYLGKPLMVHALREALERWLPGVVQTA